MSILTRRLRGRPFAVCLLILDAVLVAALPLLAARGAFDVWILVALFPLTLTGGIGLWLSNAPRGVKVALGLVPPLSLGIIALALQSRSEGLAVPALCVSGIVVCACLVVAVVAAGHGWARYFRKPTAEDWDSRRARFARPRTASTSALEVGATLPEPVRATTRDGLPTIEGLLHDEFFKLGDVRLLPEEQVLEIPFRRVFHDRPHRVVRHWLLCRTVEVDVLRCLLRVRHVTDCLVDDRSDIGTYSFCSVTYDDGTLQIEMCEDLTIWVKIEELDIELYELGVQGKARIRYFLIAESYSGKVRE